MTQAEAPHVSGLVARVLIDSPLPQLDRLFDYAVPPELADAVAPGIRVRVPLRSAGRIVDGYLVELATSTDSTKPLSQLDAVVSTVPVLTDEVYRLARRCADRAAGSASDILRLIIPRRMVRAEKAWLARDTASATADPLAPGAQEWAAQVLSAFPGLDEALAGGERVAVDAPPRPAERVGAWAELVAAAAIATLSRDKSAVLVVPDYRDQEQLIAALAGRVDPHAVVRDDARQSGPERYASYLRRLEPTPCIVLGNRSTVYSPAASVGMVALWDDGDPLLAEPLSPGVHARDAALLRQEAEHSALMFVGHTRTTDVERLVQHGWVREVPASRPHKPRIVLPSAHEEEAGAARIPSRAFAAAREALATGPVLVQVARPGYSPVLVCAQCRTPTRCRHCGGPLRARRAGAAPECTWCGRSDPNWTCPVCASTRLRMASSGSERTADELGRAFPGTRVIVSDGDHPVTHVDGKPALVVATRGAEPFAEGGYQAVILLDGDRMLLAEQLRVGESCLRWWSDAAALAAPGAPVHLVGVSGPLARAFATWTQASYARGQLAERAPLRMPPTVRVAAVEGTPQAVAAALAQLPPVLTAHPDGVEPVLGPVPLEESAAVRPRTAAPAQRAEVRALVRFDYAAGAAVAGALRAAVVSEAVHGRKRGRDRSARPTLRVRLDVPELDL